MNIPTKELFCFGILVLSAASPAQAALTVSSAPTANVTCAKATCTATAADAVLNVTHLQNLLAKANPKLVSGSVAGDIVIAASLTWPSTHTLTLDAYHSVIVNQPVTVAGTGGFSVLTNDGGTGGIFSFGAIGHVVFWDLSSKLTINGASYTLVGDIASLTSNVSANQTGDFALAANYDASVNGVYSNSPVKEFSGAFEGLGNTISNLAITNPAKKQNVGLFGQIDSSAVVENLALWNAQIAGGHNGYTSALAGRNEGQLSNISASGSITGKNSSYIGAIVGGNFGGTIINSHASATIQGCCYLGGLVGGNAGIIQNSYATGDVSGEIAGGLVGTTGGQIYTSYATGTVKGKTIGGLAGASSAIIENSYATGHITSEQTQAMVGGLIGLDTSEVLTDCYAAARVKGPFMTGGLVGFAQEFIIANTYWDFTTSGLKNSGFGAGDIPNAPGIFAMTTAQLQSGLPSGFDPSIWAESPSINGGLPYLISNPPT